MTDQAMSVSGALSRSPSQPGSHAPSGGARFQNVEHRSRHEPVTVAHSRRS